MRLDPVTAMIFEDAEESGGRGIKMKGAPCGFHNAFEVSVQRFSSTPSSLRSLSDSLSFSVSVVQVTSIPSSHSLSLALILSLSFILSLLYTPSVHTLYINAAARHAGDVVCVKWIG